MEEEGVCLGSLYVMMRMAVEMDRAKEGEEEDGVNAPSSLSLSLSLSHRRIGRGGKDAENEQWGGGGRDSTEFVKHTSFVLPT